MKISVLVGLLIPFLQGTLADVEVEKFSPEELACISDNNLDKNEIQAILEEDTLYIPEDNPRFNVMQNCYWIKKGYQNEDGSINYENMINFIKTFTKQKLGGKKDSGFLGLELATESVNGCKNVPPGDSHGHTAAKVQNCVTKNMIDLVKMEL